jgi:hypothetical protein
MANIERADSSAIFLTTPRTGDNRVCAILDDIEHEWTCFGLNPRQAGTAGSKRVNVAYANVRAGRHAYTAAH